MKKKNLHPGVLREDTFYGVLRAGFISVLYGTQRMT